MKFVRSIFGRGDDAAGADAASGAVAPTVSPAEEEAARDRELARDFDSRLTDFQRRQLEMAALAPPAEAPSQVDRRGMWVLAESADVALEDGRRADLAEGTQLEFVRQLEAPAGAGSIASIQLRTSDGRLVTIESDPDDDWPAILVRPSELDRGEG
jgi:hypothetical protein